MKNLRWILIYPIWILIALTIGIENIFFYGALLVIIVLSNKLIVSRYLNSDNLLFISIIGGVYVTTYFLNYNSIMSPYGDDAFFLKESQSSGLSFFNIFPTYLLLLSKFFFYLNIEKNEFLLIVYFIQWIIYATLITSSFKVLTSLFSFNFNFKIYSFLLIGFTIIQWSFIHIYRDSLLFLIIFISLGYIRDRRFLLASLLLVIIFLLRGGTFALFLISVLLFRYRGSLLQSNFKIIRIFKIIGLIIISFTLSGLLNFIVPYISRFGNIEGQTQDISFNGFLSNRVDFFLDQDGIENQTTYKIMQLPIPAQLILLPVANLISPVSTSKFNVKDKRVSFKYNVKYVNDYRDYTFVFGWIQLAAISIFLPLFFKGFIKFYQFSSKSFAFLVVSIIFIYSISFISYVPRHRVLFLIPFILMASIETSKSIRSSEKRISVLIFVFLVMFNLLFN